MPRHVHGMRPRGGDLAIVPGGGEAVRRERRGVAGMNDVVHHSRMIGTSGIQGIQHGHGLAFRREAGVVRRLRRQ
jgi:hypothetical protein